MVAAVVFAAAVRLVSCAPAATETIYDLGAEDCLVGRSSACLYPAAATNLPSVGGYSAPSIERIVACSPTHVLVSYLADPSLSNRLERLGIRVLQFPCERLKDYAPMRARLAELCGIRPKRVLAVVQKSPMIVAGRETLPDDILAEVGCANAVTNRTGYFVLSPEARVKLAPEGEVDFSMNYDLTRLGPHLQEEIAKLRESLATAKMAALHGDGDGMNDALFRLRVWRILAGLLVGAALALAGAVLQTVLRNPLADPFVLGLSGVVSLVRLVFFRAGADLMVGSLPGTVQGIDFIEGVPVFYSLGDLLNGSTSAKPKNQQGLLAQVTFGFGEEDQPVSVSIISETAAISL